MLRTTFDNSTLQVECGVKLISHCSDAVFVFASFWPSWFFAAQASGFNRISVYVEDLSELSKVALGAVMKGVGETLLSRKDWLDSLSRATREEEGRVIVLMQGPERAMNTMQRALTSVVDGGYPRLALLMVETPKPGSGTNDNNAKGRGHKRGYAELMQGPFSTFELSHEMVGGVVDHMWKFSINKRLSDYHQESLQRSARVVSCVADFLSTTESGAHIKAPKRERLAKLPWKQRSVMVQAKCVFSQSGWVQRRITVKELMLMYDLGMQEEKTMGQVFQRLGRELPTDFSQQVPMRVLLRGLEVLRTEEEEEEKIIEGFKAIGEEKLEEQRTVTDVGVLDNRTLEKQMLEVFRTTQEATRGAGDAEKQAAKNDDAQVKVHEWNERVCEGLGVVYRSEVHDAALDTLRGWLLARYRSFRSGVIGSFKRFMVSKYGCDWLSLMRKRRKGRRGGNKDIVLDYDVGMDAIRRALGASFWEWEEGSTIFFWRWPIEVRNELRDGLRVWYRARELPDYWGRQRWPEDARRREQLREKISKVLARNYIESGYVRSLTSYFAVPKGTDDIRVVYDATKSGLNAAIWTPNFFLPTATSVLNNATDCTFFGDIDLGEMFLNFFLDKRLRPWAGVDVSALLRDNSDMEDKDQTRWILRWERSLMGVRSSPFNCVRAYLLSEDVIRGDHRQATNPFRWDRVILNLPGSAAYDPSRPWLYKFDDMRNKLAAFVVSYVDDLRTGDDGGQQMCDHVTHHVATRLNYLGEQDAARKRGSASQKPGAWAGSVIESREKEGLFVTISQEKWNKVQKILEGYWEKMMEAGEGEEIWLEHKQLEQDTGFLVHVCMTYENMRSYLKGFYLTLNEWRFDRDGEGWKLGKRHWEDCAVELFADKRLWSAARETVRMTGGQNDTPRKVKMLPHLAQDVTVLRSMFEQECPSKRLIRGLRVARILYGFGDASGAGFGTSWEVIATAGEGQKDPTIANNSEIQYRFGRWGKDADDTSSNYRELRNVVDSLEVMGRAGELSGVEVFLFTDNSTAEAACARGSSSSKPLFELVKRLKLLEMIFRTRLHVIHVSGKRMIAQGADGLSRGCLSEGVMRGEKMTAFVPLHKTAFERSEGIIKWIREQCDVKGEPSFRLLKPEDWYVLGQDIEGGTCNSDGMWLPSYGVGNFIWSPPPCVALQCLEELRKARHKRQVSSHIFVCPRVMATSWQRHLYKSADLVFSIPPGHTHWNEEQYEPLLVGIYFPYLQHEPWQLKGSPKILGVAGRLQRVCKTDSLATGCILRQLWSFARKLPSMPQHVVSRLLQGIDSVKLPETATRKRRGTSLEKDKRRGQVPEGSEG